MLKIIVVPSAPPDEAVIVDLSGDQRPAGRGFLVRLIEPMKLLAAARGARLSETRWVIHNLDTLPCGPRRAAAFACSLTRAHRGTTYVVLSTDTLRERRIAGHLRCAVARS